MNKNSFDGHLVFKSSKNFNKASGRSNHNKNLEKITKFFEKKINLKKNQLFRNNDGFCPFIKKNCKKIKKKKIFTKNGFIYNKCQCEMVFVNPVLKEEIFHSNLFNENSYNKVMRSRANLDLDIKKFSYGLEQAKVKNNSKILDIGCGFGFFLDIEKKKGHDVYGSELNLECIKIMKEKNIPNINIENIKNTKFDLITLWTVFEHIINPNFFLKKISFLLNKKGKILINVPNLNSLTARILHKECSMFHGHQHLNFYSPNTLGNLLKKNGFKVFNMETIISDIDTIRNHLSFDRPYKDSSNKDFYFLNSDLIHKNLMGYTLLTIAEKR